MRYGDRARRRAQLCGHPLRPLLFFPLDVIFDFIPFFGYIDDLAVISLVLDRIKGEIERYEKIKGS